MRNKVRFEWRVITATAVLSALPMGLALNGTVDLAQAAPTSPTEAPLGGCVTRPADNVAAYNSYTNPLVKREKITKAEQDYFRCHPDQLTLPGAGEVSVRDMAESSGIGVGGAPVRAAVSCDSGFQYKDSITHHQKDPGLISPALQADYSLNWCYDKKARKVRDWSGVCGGSVTTYGKIQGWSFEGCTQNDFIPYTFSGSYPGGVHHYMKMHFVNNFTVKAFTYDFVEQIWGHGDGSCDTKPYEVSVYHFC